MLPTVDWIFLCGLKQWRQPSTGRPSGQPDLDSFLSRPPSQVIIGCIKLTVKANYLSEFQKSWAWMSRPSGPSLVCSDRGRDAQSGLLICFPNFTERDLPLEGVLRLETHCRQPACHRPNPQPPRLSLFTINGILMPCVLAQNVEVFSLELSICY